MLYGLSMLTKQGEGVAATHQTHIVYGVEMTGDFVAGLIHSNRPTGCHCHHHRRPNEHRSHLRPDLRIGRGWHCLGYEGAEMSELIEKLRSRNGRADGFGIGPVCDEAADRIEHLERVLSEVRDLLGMAENGARREAIAAIDEALK